MVRSFLSLAFCALVFVSCATMGVGQKPEAKLKEVYLKEADLSGATLVFVVNVFNPNNHDLKVDEVTYKVFLAGKEVSRAKTDKNILVPAQKEAEVPIPLPISYSQLFENIGAAFSAGSVIYKIEGDAKVSPFSIPFSKEGKIELR